MKTKTPISDKNQFWLEILKLFVAMPADAAVHCLLERLGYRHNADRVFLAQADKALGYARNTHEWRAHGVSPTLGSSREMSLEPYRWIGKRLRRGHDFQANRADVPPRYRSFQRRLEEQRILSCYFVPIFSGSSLFAALGYHKTTGIYRWSPSERQEARQAAEVLGEWLRAKELRMPASETALEEPSIFVKSGGEALAIPASSIISIEGAVNYSRVHMQEGAPVLKYRSLESWGKMLPESHFLRVHRSHIVNTTKITKLARNAGAWKITLADGNALPVGRMYRKKLATMLRA